MRVISIFLVLLIAGFARAGAPLGAVEPQTQPPNDCSNEALQLADWTLLTPAEMSCLEQDESFQTNLRVLCEADHRQLSSEFSDYLRYERLYKEALREMESTTEPSAAVRSKVRNAREDWDNLGHRYEITRSKYLVKRAYQVCQGR